MAKTPDELQLEANLRQTEAELDRKRDILQNAQQTAGVSAHKAKKAEDEHEEHDAWNKLAQEAEQLGAAHRKGYDTFETALNDILSACITMNKAIFYSAHGKAPLSFEDVGNFVGAGFSKGSDLYNYVRGKSSTVPTAAVLPTIKPIFTVADDGEIKLTEFKLDSGEDLSLEQKNTVKHGIQLWLQEQVPAYVVDRDGTVKLSGGAAAAPPVDPDELVKTLEGMRDHPDTGINAFFRKHGARLEVAPEINRMKP